MAVRACHRSLLCASYNIWQLPVSTALKLIVQIFKQLTFCCGTWGQNGLQRYNLHCSGFVTKVCRPICRCVLYFSTYQMICQKLQIYRPSFNLNVSVSWRERLGYGHLEKCFLNISVLSRCMGISVPSYVSFTSLAFGTRPCRLRHLESIACRSLHSSAWSTFQSPAIFKRQALHLTATRLRIITAVTGCYRKGLPWQKNQWTRINQGLGGGKPLRSDAVEEYAVRCSLDAKRCSPMQ